MLKLSPDEARKQQLLQFQELQELRHDAYENATIYNEKTKPFHNRHIWRRSFQVNDKVWLYNSRLKLFHGKLRFWWDGPYVVLELFNDGSVLISDIKSGRQFKVNANHLKPYLTSEPPAPADKINLHLPEHSRTWRYHPRPFNSCRFYFGFVWLKTLNLALLGGTPRLSYLLVFCVFSFKYRRTILRKGALARNPANEHHGFMCFSNLLSSRHIFVSFSCHDSVLLLSFTWAYSFHWGHWKILVGGWGFWKISTIFKNFKILSSKNSYFFKNLICSTSP